MNKIVMVVWGLVIFSLCGLILLIGFKNQDREYIKYIDVVKTAGKSYIKDNRITTKLGDSYIINIDELVNGQYIEDDEKIKAYCIEGVVYTNTFLMDSYTVRTNCEDKEQ
jgi:hypothetical protein